MIISKIHALRLIRAGKARAESALVHDAYGRVYVVLTRFDVQRTDHYLET